MLYSGIDLHKRTMVIHTLDANGTTTREAALQSDRGAVLAYFGTLSGPHTAPSSSACRAGIGSATCWRRLGVTCGSPTRNR